MAKLIPFSGASNSGKTTTILKILQQNKNVKQLDEIIRRNSEQINIDDIRANPAKYLDLQININNQKISEELDVFNRFKKSDDIILIDRSIIDSLFYCTFYLDKSLFNQNELERYCLMLDKIIDHIKADIYYKILIFEPIKEIDLDNGLRTKKLKYYQDYEYFFIKSITHGNFDKKKILEVKTADIQNIIQSIYSL